MNVNTAIKVIFSNEEYTRAAVCAYLLTGGSMWKLLEGIYIENENAEDVPAAMFESLKLLISENV